MRHDAGLDHLGPPITGQAALSLAPTLTPAEQQFIVDAARDSGCTPDELLAAWLRDKMAEAARARILQGEVLDRLVRLERVVEEMDSRQRTIEGQLNVFFRLAGGGAGTARSALEPGPWPGQSAPADAADRRPLLHEEIATVLQEAGQPLSTREIADRIREKGRYVPPRTEKPISSATVSARVSHPGYRARFHRLGRKIELAPAAR